jgi:hypothetical protein
MLNDLLQRGQRLPGGLVNDFESMAHLMYPGDNAAERLRALRELAQAN